MDRIIYSLFVISIMIGNGLYFGPCTLRQYCSVYLLFYVFMNRSMIHGYSRLIFSYMLFICMYGISSLIDNNFSTYIRQLVALYTVSILGYYSTIIILKKYKSYEYFINGYIYVGIVNACIIILQYLNNKYAFLLGAVFVDMNDPVKVAQLTRMMEGNHSNLIGIMGDIVYNGYYAMILPFIILLKFKNSNILFKYGLLIISLISLFMVGERSCFGITVLLLLWYLYSEVRHTPSFYLSCLVAFAISMWYMSDFINSDAIQSSRWVGEDSGVRDNLQKAILPFIFDHFLFGGLKDFIKLTKFPPHNVVASGFIYAGFIGGICVISILLKQAQISYFLIRNKKNVLLSLSFVAYTLNGFFHNPAIVTGDAMVWILWGIVIYSYKTRKSNKRIYIDEKTTTGTQLSFNLNNCSYL